MEDQKPRPLRIGVLALQGAFIEHIKMLERLGVQGREVRLPADLEELDGLIIPGGESTTIGKLMERFELGGPNSYRFFHRGSDFEGLEELENMDIDIDIDMDDLEDAPAG